MNLIIRLIRICTNVKIPQQVLEHRLCFLEAMWTLCVCVCVVEQVTRSEHVAGVDGRCWGGEVNARANDESAGGAGAGGDEKQTLWRPLLLIIPLRLGLQDINPAYIRPLKVHSHTSNNIIPLPPTLPPNPPLTSLASYLPPPTRGVSCWPS